MATICPYCAIDINESAIEAEDGCCPECGAALPMRSLYDDDDIDDYDEFDEYDEFDDEDDFFDEYADGGYDDDYEDDFEDIAFDDDDRY
jgi:hypothetical protein